MNSSTHWESFLKTGRIADYLRYREALRAETAQELCGTPQSSEKQEKAEAPQDIRS